MYSVTFVYTNNNKVVCRNINSITYLSKDKGITTATGDQLLECNILHQSEVHLKSADSSYSVSTNEVLSIQISKE